MDTLVVLPNVYTSYFGGISRLPENVRPIAICGSLPKGYKGAWYKRLAPSWSIWKQWKDSKEADRDKVYTARFQKEVLSRLDAADVVSDLDRMANHEVPCLVCYEKPGAFCHRHLVSNWLNDSGLVRCVEFEGDK